MSGFGTWWISVGKRRLSKYSVPPNIIVFTTISFICITYISMIYAIYHSSVKEVDMKCQNGKP